MASTSHTNASSASIDSVSTIATFDPPQMSFTKVPKLGVGNSRLQGLVDMNIALDVVRAFLAKNHWVGPEQAERFAKYVMHLASSTPSVTRI